MNSLIVGSDVSLVPALPAGSETQSLARHIAAARLAGAVIDDVGDGLTSIEAALAIQADVLALMQDNVGGWKAAGMHSLGFALTAPIHQRALMASGARRAPVAGWGVEVELGFQLRRDIGEGEMLTPATIRTVLGDVVVCLELCRTRLPGQPHPLLFLADGLANDGVVWGSGLLSAGAGEPQSATLAGRAVRLRLNGAAIQTSITPPEDELLRTLCWLTAQPRRLGGLRAGQVIITGSLTGLTPVKAGDQVEASIDGIGEVMLSA